MTSDTKFRIASISKNIGTLAFMTLVEQGLVSLETNLDDILHYKIRNPYYPTTPIKIRHILSHTSSFQDGPFYDDFLTDTYHNLNVPTIYDYLFPTGNYYSSDNYVPKKPGTYFQYCNFNFGLMGTILEILTNTRFDIYVRNTILIPMGITEASFNVADLPDISKLATLYGWDSTT
jgi:CubicO group peptidase (beta-lactamase class C family)